MALRKIAVEDLYKKDEKLKKEDVDALMDWISKQPHLPRASELQVALFLHSCYYSNETAKSTIDAYFTVKTICSDIFGAKNIDEPVLQTSLRTIFISPLPKATAEGERIIFGKLIDTDPENYFLASQCNLFDLATLQHIYQEGPDQGVHIVIDMKGVVFGHFLKLNPMVIKKFLYYLQEAMPIRLKSLHFVNIVSFMDKILALMKPFMKKELIDALYLHNGVETIFSQLPKELFPQDYGGDVESVPILHEKCRRKIVENAEFWKYLADQRVDETRRRGKSKSSEIFGVEGSFKKLEVD
ncbi:unnamed protein product [Phyllotreta striolata]|uniref:CRAL-TRIO domain-containing protein n=1 Tax=Phyllotreta striolata TaxID=444603 RepID=A0A9N9TMP4_PHYSR|nr:unnamed protein product [Phyllotreta striolata]